MSVTDFVASVEYRLVDGFPGYRVGNDGLLWSCLTNHGKLGDTWKRVHGKPNKDGYLQVVLYGRDGKRRTCRIHTLVLEAFVGPKPHGTEARHYPDSTRTNNAASNLSWANHSVNHADKREHGTHQIGESHGMHRLTEADVVAIDSALCDGEDRDQIASRFAVCRQEIEAIAQCRLWPHVPRSYVSKQLVEAICRACNATFQVTMAQRWRRKFCSTRCRDKANNLLKLKR